MATDTQKNILVTQRRDGKFAVKPEGARCATKTFANKEEALAFAQQLADEKGVKVIAEA